MENIEELKICAFEELCEYKYTKLKELIIENKYLVQNFKLDRFKYAVQVKTEICIKNKEIAIVLDQNIYNDDDDGETLFFNMNLLFKFKDDILYNLNLYNDIYSSDYGEEYIDYDNFEIILGKIHLEFFKILKNIYDKIDSCVVCKSNYPYCSDRCEECCKANIELKEEIIKGNNIKMCFCCENNLDSLMYKCYKCHYILHNECLKKMICKENIFSCPYCRTKLRMDEVNLFKLDEKTKKFIKVDE